MYDIDIAWRRQVNQRLVGEPFVSVEAAIRGLCCVQAQDYYGASWALGLRTPGCTTQTIDRLMEQGAILRTHMMRPTWHFVLPEDIRWIQRLTASRVHAMNAGICRRVGVEKADRERATELISAALRGGRHMTRAEVASALEEGGISTGGMRTVYYLMHAELEQVICSGGRRGKEQTYALLDELAPADSGPVERKEAIVSLADRYLQRHSPATAQDFAWWSGLTVSDARAGFDAMGNKYLRRAINGKEYLLAPEDEARGPSQCAVRLLPNFDESFVAYANRTAAVDPAIYKDRNHANVAFLGNVITIDGKVVGTWRRTVGRNEVQLQTMLLRGLTSQESAALDAASERYAEFLGRPTTIALVPDTAVTSPVHVDNSSAS